MGGRPADVVWSAKGRKPTGPGNQIIRPDPRLTRMPVSLNRWNCCQGHELKPSAKSSAFRRHVPATCSAGGETTTLRPCGHPLLDNRRPADLLPYSTLLAAQPMGSTFDGTPVEFGTQICVSQFTPRKSRQRCEECDAELHPLASYRDTSCDGAPVRPACHAGSSGLSWLT